MANGVRTAVVAWLITAVYYFYQYALRSAPAVMMPQLSDAFGLSATGVASIVGLFYYGYSPFSLVAGAAMDRLGPRKVVPVGAAMVGIGALLFGSGGVQAAGIGGSGLFGDDCSGTPFAGRPGPMGCPSCDCVRSAHRSRHR